MPLNINSIWFCQMLLVRFTRQRDQAPRWLAPKSQRGVY